MLKHFSDQHINFMSALKVRNLSFVKTTHLILRFCNCNERSQSYAQFFTGEILRKITKVERLKTFSGTIIQLSCIVLHKNIIKSSIEINIF